MDVDTELRRLSREFIADIERIIRPPHGCVDDDAEVAAVVDAIMDGMALGATEAALDLAEALDVLPAPWSPK